MTFEILTPENSQAIALNDNAGRAPSETWITAQGSIAMWHARNMYARKHGIDITRVGYSCRPVKPEEV